MKNWLAKANGWKRLWFLCSCIGLFLSVFIFPFTLTAEYNSQVAEFSDKVAGDLRNSSCEPFAIKLFKELVEPDYSDGCWHLYTHRNSRNDLDNIPYTLEKLNKTTSREIWRERFVALGLFTAFTIIISGLSYLFGVTIKWIYLGFRNNS